MAARPVRLTRDGVVETAGDAGAVAAQPLHTSLQSLIPTFLAPPASTAPNAAPSVKPEDSFSTGTRLLRSLRGADPTALTPSRDTPSRDIAPAPTVPSPTLQSHRLDDLLHVVQQLSQSLSDENDALSNRIPELIEAGLDRKQRLGQIYHEYMVSIRRNPRQLESLPTETRVALKAAAENLDQLAAENNRLLKIHMSVVDTLLTTVITAVKEQTLAGTTYSDTGQAGLYATEARLLAVSMNQEF